MKLLKKIGLGGSKTKIRNASFNPSFNPPSFKKDKRGKRKKERDSHFERQLLKDASDGFFEVESNIGSEVDQYSLPAYDSSIDLSRILGYVSDSSCGTRNHQRYERDDSGSIMTEEDDVDEDLMLFETGTASTRSNLKSSSGKSGKTEVTCKSAQSLEFMTAQSVKSRAVNTKKTVTTPSGSLQPYVDNISIPPPPPPDTEDDLNEDIEAILEDSFDENDTDIITQVPHPTTIIDLVNKNNACFMSPCISELTEIATETYSPLTLSSKKLERHEQACTEAVELDDDDEPFTDVLPHFNRWKKNQEIRKVLSEKAKNTIPDHHTEETRSAIDMLQQHHSFNVSDPSSSRTIEKLKTYESPKPLLPKTYVSSDTATPPSRTTATTTPPLTRLQKLKHDTHQKRNSLKKSMKQHLSNIKTSSYTNNANSTASLSKAPPKMAPPNNITTKGDNFYTVLLERELFQTTPASSIMSSSISFDENNADILVGKMRSISVISEENDVIVKGKCVICMERVRTHVALPCMHFSFCESCSNDILTQQNLPSDGESGASSSCCCPVCDTKGITFSELKY